MPRGHRPKQGANSPTTPPSLVPNPQRGEVVLKVGEQHYLASINFDKASRLIELFAAPGEGSSCNFGQAALQAWLAGDVVKISAAVAILTGLTTEEIYELSPPWEASFQVISKTYNLFFFGSEEAPGNEREDSEEDPLARGHRAQTPSSSTWLGRMRSVLGLSPANSGPLPSTKSASTQEHRAN